MYKCLLEHEQSRMAKNKENFATAVWSTVPTLSALLLVQGYSGDWAGTRDDDKEPPERGAGKGKGQGKGKRPKKTPVARAEEAEPPPKKKRCFNWNNGKQCASSPCPFAHECLNCGDVQHRRPQCPKK